MVSYERAIQSPDVFIKDLAAFLNITPTHEVLQEALARINPRGGYLRVDEQCHPITIAKPLPEVVTPKSPEPPKSSAPIE